MMIEVKTFNETMVDRLTSLTRENHRDKYTVFGYNGVGNQEIGQMTDETLTFYKQKQLLKVFLFSLFGIIHFTTLKRGVATIPLVDEGYKYETKRENSSWITAMGVIGFSYFLQYFSLLVTPYLKHRGVPTILFNADTEKNMKWAAATEAVGIMSNRPKKVREFLDSQGQHFVYQDKSQ